LNLRGNQTMGMFFDVLSAINNPNQQANISHLETMTNAVQKIATDNGLPAGQMPGLLSAVGSAVIPALQQKAGGSGNPLEQVLGQVLGGGIGGGIGASALQSLFPSQAQSQMIEGIAQKTGLSTGMLQAAVPALLPVVMNFLNMGANKPGHSGGNPLLSAFLGGGQNSGAELGNVLSMASRFLNPAH
jgi:hypothetical protein